MPRRAANEASPRTEFSGTASFNDRNLGRRAVRHDDLLRRRFIRLRRAGATLLLHLAISGPSSFGAADECVPGCIDGVGLLLGGLSCFSW